MNTQEIKNQAHKEFDEKFSKLKGLRPHLDFEDLHLFIDSLIDRTVQLSEERIVEEVKKIILENSYEEYLGAGGFLKTNTDILMFKIQPIITNKSDINK